MPRNILTRLHLCLAFIALTSEGSIAQAQLPTANKITCVLAVDHHAGDVDADGGRARTAQMAVAENAFRRLVEDAATAGNVTVHFEAINNDRVTRSSILDTIRQAPVDSSTTLVVYYHGHSGTDGAGRQFLHHLPETVSLSFGPKSLMRVSRDAISRCWSF